MISTLKKLLLVFSCFFNTTIFCFALPATEPDIIENRMVNIEYTRTSEADVTCMAYLVSENHLATSKQCARKIRELPSPEAIKLTRNNGERLVIKQLETTAGDYEDIAYLLVGREGGHSPPVAGKTIDSNQTEATLWYPVTLDDGQTTFKPIAVSPKQEEPNYLHLSLSLPEPMSGNPVVHNGQLICIYSEKSGLCSLYDNRHNSRKNSRKKRGLPECQPLTYKKLINCEGYQPCSSYCPQNGCYNDGYYNPINKYHNDNNGTNNCYRRILRCSSTETYCEYNEQEGRCTNKDGCDFLNRVCKEDCSEFECHVHTAAPGKINTWTEPRPCFSGDEKNGIIGLALGLGIGLPVLVIGTYIFYSFLYR